MSHQSRNPEYSGGGYWGLSEISTISQPLLPPPYDGLKLHSHERPIGRSALARDLERTLEHNFNEKSSTSGASLAREGRLHDIRIGEDGIVSARAVGADHYEVVLRFDTLSPKTRARLPHAILTNPEIVRGLSRGQIPLDALDTLIWNISPDAEELVPRSVKGTCSCPYGAGCKHQAALCYLLVEAIDADQTFLLAMRGISRKELLQEIGSPPIEAVVAPRGVSLAEFWAPAQMPNKIIIPRPEPQRLLGRLTDMPEGISLDEALAVQEMLLVIFADADALVKVDV